MLKGILSKDKNAPKQDIPGSLASGEHGKTNVSYQEYQDVDSSDAENVVQRERDRSLSPGSTKRSA